MKLSRCLLVVLLILAAAQAVPAHAEGTEYRGWGPRFGLGDDPDQAIVGVHFDLGEIFDEVRFIPSAEIGFGDDHTVLALTAPAFYRWEHLTNTNIVPYAGGGLTAALVERDRSGSSDDTDFELALKAIGGAEWNLRNRRTFFVELQLVFGDVHDIEVIAGWTFGK